MDQTSGTPAPSFAPPAVAARLQSVRARWAAVDGPMRLVLVVIGAGLIARLVLAAVIGLGVDESYAVSVARGLSLSYFDHPPLSFWMPGVLAKLVGSENAVLLRLPFILLFAGTTWLMFRLTARLFGRLAGAYAALALNLAPVFSVSTGGWVLPDGPLMFFLLATALCLTHVLFDAPPRASFAWWIGAGVMLGFAALSKYHAIFIPAGVLLFLLTRRDRRHWLASLGPYVGGAIALAMATPVWIWNARHGWVSFRFQFGRGASSHGIHLLAMLQNIGGQMGYLLPWIWVPLVWLLIAGLVAGARDARRWFFICLAVCPIAFFTLISLGGNPGLPHWPAPGYLFLFPLLGAAITPRIERHDVMTRRWLTGSVIALVLLVVAAASDIATGWITRVAPSLARRGDPTFEALDWRDLDRAITARRLLDHQMFVAATNWIEAGKVSYALGPGVPVLCLSGRPHHFLYLHDERTFVGRNALLVMRGPANARRALAIYEPYFAVLEPLGAVPIRREGRVAFTVALYRAEGFQRPFPTDQPK